MNRLKSFTLLEILVVVSALAIILGIVIIAVNPAKNFAEARNYQRDSDVNTLLSAISQYTLDNDNTLPTGIGPYLTMIGTSNTGCDVACGDSLPVAEVDINNNEYSLIPAAKALEVKQSPKPNNAPVIYKADIYPKKVLPGETLTVTIKARSEDGIASIDANMGGIETKALTLVDGSNKDGTWELKWKVHSTKEQRYTTDITVTSLIGTKASTQLQWSDPIYGGWLSPSSVTAPTGQWTNLANANDANTVTYASNNYAGTGWGQYIYFNLSSAISSNRLRIIADYLDSHVSQVQIDLFKDGAWETVFLGGNEAAWNAAWVEVTYPVGSVTQARFRYNYSTGGYYFWVYEFQFYETGPSIIPPVTVSQNAQLIQDVYATLKGDLLDDGGEPCSYRFAYGLTNSYGSTTPWINGATSGDTLTAFVSGLTPLTSYHFRVEVMNSAGTDYGEDKIFTTLLPALGNFSPSGFIDPDNQWTNETNAIDGNLASYAASNHAIGSNQWSSYLYFTQDSRYTNGISYYARGLTEVDQVQIDVHLDGNWVTVHSGSFTGMQSNLITFNQGLVDQARIRFHATNANTGFFWQLYDFTFRKSSESTSAACVDLSSLAPEYLVSIPTDPLTGSSARTYYAVKQLSDTRVAVYSCSAELNRRIVDQR